MTTGRSVCFAFGLLGVLIGGGASSRGMAQSAGPSMPDPNVKEILANARVSVRDVTWKNGTLRATNHFQESVTVFLQGGRMRIVKPDGGSTTVTRKTGEVVAEPRSQPDAREAVDAPVRGIVLDLHDNVVPGLSND